LKTPFIVNIERIIPGGRGLAFHEGRATFVPFSVPGDRILVQQFEDRRDYLSAQSIRVVEASPQRVAAPCPYFGKCGGCDFQHMSYERQLASKKEILVDALKHVGKIDFPTSKVSVIPSPRLGYRNRLQLKISHDGADSSWGFFQHASHQVFAVENCLIASEDLWKFLSSLREILKASPLLRKGPAEVEVFQGRPNQYLVELQIGAGEWDLELLGKELQQSGLNRGSAEVSFFLSLPSGKALKISGEGFVWKRVGSLEYRVSRGSFFQVNDYLLESLRDCVVSGFSGKRVLDFYSGVGFFSLALAKNFEEVWAVEMNASAVEDFQENVKHNQVGNCTLFAQDLRTFIQEHGSRLEGVDLILIDPPRTGLAKETINQVCAIGSVEVVYVSCDPSTLARDLRTILTQQYQLCSLHLLDLFPQTHHLETVARLRKASP
jgi:23S rRNA (uracil1939-C5)-methyltransferase